MRDPGKQTQTVAGGPGAGPVLPKLVVVEGPDAGIELAFDRAVVVGSDPAADLCLSDGAISRKHVSIQQRAGVLVVRDLGSRNGTFLGATKVVEAEVPLGAVLTIGRTTISIQPRWQVREVAPSSARSFGELVGESVVMREVFALLERAAATDVTVLIEGESGTGKELASRAVHAASARASRPYVVFDCGAVPGELAESELFGHRKGAFSGALSDRAGAVPRAAGGTLCLDEIGELPLELQPKLLRVLETQEVRPVGADTHQKIDFRVIAATNRDLHAEVGRGRFRSDLLYRLEVVRVRMPPLRARPEDIPITVARLLEGKIDPDEPPTGPNLTKLMSYGWPGNVRELRNVLARAVALATPRGHLPRFSELAINLGPPTAAAAPSLLGGAMPGVGSRVPYKDAKSQLLLSFDRAYLADVMERAGGNITRAAELAGLSRKHMYDFIKRVEEAREQ